ncbi:MAG: rod shape-determining protein MreD [Marinilabiliaceae bacterium]|jgi:rod shape-determining protein MreD|nr:rod shape-determining protein MreD [Marinilabiliaceae bacterium]
MLNDIIKYTGIFVLIILIQVLIMDNIGFSGYVNPYVYILFILLLPIKSPAWLVLFLSFFTGLTVDLFEATPGLHTSASLFAGFLRPYILRIIAPHDGYEKTDIPGIAANGFRWFLVYVALMVGLHHFFLFYMEVFRLSHFFITLARVVVSSFFSILFIVILQTLFIRR